MIFTTIYSFYNVRGGKLSGELDFGVWWYDTIDRRGAPHRVSWVVDTGDLYATEGYHGLVELLGTIMGDRDNIERVLKGWEDKCGGADSLAWVRERVAASALAQRGAS